MSKNKNYNKNYMAALYALLFLCLPLTLRAEKQYQSILQCLGMEEMILHRKKLRGPIYDLNQKLISEVSSGNLMKVKDEIIKEICLGKDFSPSVNFLRNLLIKGKSIYEFDRENEKVFRLQKAATETLQQKVPNLFFTYLISLQSLTNKADCLYKAIPEFNYFIQRFRYLQEEIHPQKLLSEKDKIAAIFERLKKIEKVIGKCNS
ncbi:MAG: hypothetical protein CME68_07790 [Halobacteriovoraceae bacterium]|nr:hypothetical protein [Halobacteriovoraceae bacterium]|tara:strand:+ start:620 stop:1234 length:615 start_codon:yes stop_codon:yes gene_type:complete